MWMCVCSPWYLSSNAHAPYFHLWSARLDYIFPHYSQTARFSKIFMEYKTCIFISLKNFSEIILFLNSDRDMIKMQYIALHVKWRSSCPTLIKLQFLYRISKNILISNFMKSLPVGAELFHAGGRTDRHNDDYIRIRNFANAPKSVISGKNAVKIY
jgi:hypothetical protein